jgi:hypothetical protein
MPVHTPTTTLAADAPSSRSWETSSGFFSPYAFFVQRGPGRLHVRGTSLSHVALFRACPQVRRRLRVVQSTKVSFILYNLVGLVASTSYWTTKAYRLTHPRGCAEEKLQSGFNPPAPLAEVREEGNPA